MITVKDMGLAMGPSAVKENEYVRKDFDGEFKGALAQ